MPSSTTMVAVPGHLLGREQKNRRSPTDRRPHNAIMAHVHHSRPQRPGHTQNNLPGSRNTVVQRHLSGPTARKWPKRIEGVTTCETPSHHARRPAGRGAGTTPDDQPADPAAPNTLQHTRRRLERVIMAGPAPHRPTTLRIAPGKRIQTPPNSLPDEEDPSEQVAGTLMLRIFKTTLLNNLEAYSGGGFEYVE